MMDENAPLLCLRCQQPMDSLGRRHFPTLSASESYYVYRCPHCRKVEFFEPPADEPAEETHCLACGAVIPAGEDDCPACGWTWRLSGGPDPETP